MSINLHAGLDIIFYENYVEIKSYLKKSKLGNNDWLFIFVVRQHRAKFVGSIETGDFIWTFVHTDGGKLTRNLAPVASPGGESV